MPTGSDHTKCATSLCMAYPAKKKTIPVVPWIIHLNSVASHKRDAKYTCHNIDQKDKNEYNADLQDNLEKEAQLHPPSVL